jgi:hypothetical protein
VCSQNALFSTPIRGAHEIFDHFKVICLLHFNQSLNQDAGRSPHCRAYSPGVLLRYVIKAGLQQVYGKDSKGRNLKMFTVHSLRHSHVTHYVIDRKLPLPIVQKQVGHRSLKTTSVYLSPSTEKMAKA